MPKILSLARAPLEYRDQTAEGSSLSRGGIGKLKCLTQERKNGPPSPPVVLSPERMSFGGEESVPASPTYEGGSSLFPKPNLSRTVSTLSSSTATSTSTSRSLSRPHERFLANAGLPPASPTNIPTEIGVTSTPATYEVHVKHASISPSSVILTTRRPRVLHLAVDNYTTGGGHWQRRIKFGRDADMKKIRAEYSGGLLRVVVPRIREEGE
jgi:HSP20 family molecular chaperone IbpA